MPQVVAYVLTPSEMQIAADVGVQRAFDAIANGRQARWGQANGANFEANINGCMGELTLAKYLDRFWNGTVGNIKAADVGQHFQVRASCYDGPNAGLMLHPEDKDAQPYVKALVRLPRVELIGWMLGRDVKQTKFWTERLQPGRPAFLAPHAVLRPMSELQFVKDGF